MLLVDGVRVPGLGVELGPADADLRAPWEAACDNVKKDEVMASARLYVCQNHDIPIRYTKSLGSWLDDPHCYHAAHDPAAPAVTHEGAVQVISRYVVEGRTE